MYKLIGTKNVKRLSDNTTIPLVDGNSDYETYKLWLSEGNTPEPEFTEDEKQMQMQSEFRRQRNDLLVKIDIEINKAEDLGKDSALLRAYRQALRDSTIKWALPENIL